MTTQKGEREFNLAGAAVLAAGAAAITVGATAGVVVDIDNVGKNAVSASNAVVESVKEGVRDFLGTNNCQPR